MQWFIRREHLWIVDCWRSSIFQFLKYLFIIVTYAEVFGNISWYIPRSLSFKMFLLLYERLVVHIHWYLIAWDKCLRAVIMLISKYLRLTLYGISPQKLYKYNLKIRNCYCRFYWIYEILHIINNIESAVLTKRIDLYHRL